MRNNIQGFTVIELMIAVTIIGVLATMILPSYRQYVVRSERAAVQAEAMNIAALLERYRAQQMTYPKTASAITTVYSATQYPVSGAAKYNLTITPASTGLTWTLLYKPASGSTQVGDGVISMDSTGRRCWKKSSDTACELSDPAQAWSTR